MSFLTNKTLDKFNIYILESFITSPELKIFKEILEVNNIIKKPQIIKNLEDIQKDKEKCNLLFFDKNSISLIKTLNNKYKNLDIKTFFVSKEINNDLYNLFYNAFVNQFKESFYENTIFTGFCFSSFSKHSLCRFIFFHSE